MNCAESLDTLGAANHCCDLLSRRVRSAAQHLQRYLASSRAPADRPRTGRFRRTVRTCGGGQQLFRRRLLEGKGSKAVGTEPTRSHGKCTQPSGGGIAFEAGRADHPSLLKTLRPKNFYCYKRLKRRSCSFPLVRSSWPRAACTSVGRRTGRRASIPFKGTRYARCGGYSGSKIPRLMCSPQSVVVQ